jgi:hypothetical protein
MVTAAMPAAASASITRATGLRTERRLHRLGQSGKNLGPGGKERGYAMVAGTRQHMGCGTLARQFR